MEHMRRIGRHVHTLLSKDNKLFRNFYLHLLHRTAEPEWKTSTWSEEYLLHSFAFIANDMSKYPFLSGIQLY